MTVVGVMEPGLPNGTPHAESGIARDVRRYAWVVFLLALTVRLVWTTLATVTPVSDCHGYDFMARQLLQTGELSHGMGRAYRAPGYTGLVAAVYAVFGDNLRAVWLIQALLGALSAALVVLLAAHMISPRGALLAGLIQAVWPTAIVYTPLLFSENLVTPLLLLALLAIASAGRRGGRGSAALFVLAGLLYGLLLLVRPANLFFGPALALVVFRDFERRVWRLRAVLLFVAALLVAWSPWAIRNYRLGLGFVPLSTQGGIVFWYGNNPLAVDGGAMPPRFPEEAGMNEVEFDKFYFQKAKDWIRAHPGRYLDLCRVRALRFFAKTPDGFAARYWWPSAQNDRLLLARDSGKDKAGESTARANALEARNLKHELRLRRVVAPLVLLAFLWALVRFRTYALVTLPVCCYVFGLTVTAFVERYRLAADPLLFIPLAALLTDIFRGTHDLGGGRRLRYVKGALAVGVVAASIYVHKARLDARWYVLPPLEPSQTAPASEPGAGSASSQPG